MVQMLGLERGALLLRQVAVGIELIPKDDAPVVWAKLEVWVDKERISPLEQTYYDEGEGGAFEFASPPPASVRKRPPTSSRSLGSLPSCCEAS